MTSLRFLFFLLAITMSAIPTGLAFADNYAKTIQVFKNSPILKPYFENAYGYAVFPTIGKGGIGIGGAYGKGQVYEKGKIRGTAKLFKATIGFQLGGQAFSEIIFFEDKRAYKEFVPYDGKFLSWSARFGLKPTSFFNFSVNLKYTRQNIKATGEQLVEGILTTTNFRYQITKQAFLSSYVQHDSRYKRLNLDAVLGIELGVGNVISFSIKRFYPLKGSPFEDKARSFAIKASYLIRI